MIGRLIYFLSVFLLTVIFLFSCEKEPITPDDDNNNNINQTGDTSQVFTVQGTGDKLSIKAEKDVISNITDISATAIGSFTQLNSNDPIVQHGHCWSATSLAPTIDDNRTQLDGKTSTGIFTSQLTNLEPLTLYKVRSYVITQSNKIGYYPQITEFTTTEPAIPRPIISFQNFAITSDDNNNSEANPGENIQLAITLKNSGNLQTNNLQLSISSINPNLIVQTSSLSFGTILPNSTATLTASIKIASNTAWGTSIPLSLRANDNSSGQEWLYEYTIDIKSPYVVIQNLIAYYTFNDGSGKDELGNYNCFLQGSNPPQYTADIPDAIGLSAQFDGNGYFANAQNPLYMNTSYTYSVWVKTTSGGSIYSHAQVSFSQTGLGINGGKVCYNIKSNNPCNMSFSTNITQLLLDGNWHLLTVTRSSAGSGNNTKLYVDGQLLESIFSSLAQNNSQSFIGNGFIGKIDNLRIYNRELSQQEISLIHNAKQ